MVRTLRRAVVLCGVIGSAALFLVGGAAADVENGNLPGGTAISVEIVSPADGAVFQLGDPVPVNGKAEVAKGVAIQDTTVVFVIDRSGSMGADAGVDCDGVAGNETRLECVQAAVIAANNAAAAAGSAVDLVGIVAFDSTASQLYFGAPGAAVDPVVNGITLGGSTCYSCGLDQATAMLNAGANTNSKNLIIFLSDGFNNVGADLKTYAPPPPGFPAGTVVKGIAMGTGVSCANEDPFALLGSMDNVAALGAAGSSCAETTDFSAVADLIAEAIGSTLTNVTLLIDGNPVSPTIVPPLPQPGPVSASFSYTALGLAAGPHTATATAFGTDALGAGSVTDVHTFFVNAPPDCTTVTPSLTELWPPNGKMTTITLSGATDPEGGTVTIAITGVTQDEVVAGPGKKRSPDAATGPTSDSVQLRAERFGNLDGRVYQISFTGTDPLGGTCTGAVTVSVPHDQSGAAAVDSGQLYNSFVP
jgi:von Willebrand factor type A domain